MKKNILLAILVFVLFLNNASAQTAMEILDKYFDAIGGLLKYDSIKTTITEGEQNFDGVVQKIKIISAENLYRSEVIRNGLREFTLLTNEGGWVYNERNEKKLKKLKSSLKNKYENAASIESSLLNYKQPGFVAVLLDKDSADGRLCFKLQINELGSQQFFIWFDTETYLKVQSSVQTIAGFYNSRGKIQDTEVNVITIFKDYKSVDGLLFPFTYLINAYSIKTKEMVRKISTFYSKIEINKPIDEKLFSPE